MNGFRDHSLYKITYKSRDYHRADDGSGSGDTVPAGISIEEHTTTGIAPSAAIAKLWVTENHAHDNDFKIVKCERIAFDFAIQASHN